MENFRHTGNSIPVTVDELVNYAISQFNQYKDTKDSNYSPVQQPIIYKTSNGKYIEIPNDIKKVALKKWNEQNKDDVIQKSKTTKTKYNQYYKYITVVTIISFLFFVFFKN